MYNFHLIQAHIYENLSVAKAKVSSASAFKCSEMNEHTSSEHTKDALKAMKKLSDIEKSIEDFMNEYC